MDGAKVAMKQGIVGQEKRYLDPLIQVENLRISYGDRRVVDGVSFEVREGQWFMLAGPNGAGKTSIVNAISRGVPYEGRIRCRGRDIRAFHSKELARQIGFLSQNHFVGYAYTVREVVSLGRYAYSRTMLENSDPGREELVSQALALTGLEELADHSVLTLSGGELQRTFLAQLFAQNADLLILDEPANHLDLVYQKQIFSLLGQWLKLPGRAVISIVHDLSLVKAFGTCGLLLRNGKTVCCGEMEEVFSEENLRQAYEMDVYDWMRQIRQVWD